MLKFILSGIMTSILLLLFGIHSSSWGESVSSFCYDEVGENHFCFKNEKDCNKEQSDNQIAESPCYKEDS